MFESDKELFYGKNFNVNKILKFINKLYIFEDGIISPPHKNKCIFRFHIDEILSQKLGFDIDMY